MALKKKKKTVLDEVTNENPATNRASRGPTDGEHPSPLSSELGNFRILRTSPLVKVSKVCAVKLERGALLD